MSRVIADGLSDKALALISSSIDADTLNGIDSLGFDAAGAADTAVSDHVALADPHSQYAELAGGASANFTAMPQVGGDPIVESGTNSNGEYTKFADGTLLLIFEDTSYDSSVSRRDYTPPSAFITSKLITVGSITSTGVLSLTDVKALTSISGVWSSSGGGEIRLFSDTVNAFTGTIYFSVIGRWF